MNPALGVWVQVSLYERVADYSFSKTPTDRIGGGDLAKNKRFFPLVRRSGVELNPDPALLNQYRQTSKVLAGVVMTGGAVVLVGWFVDVPLLKSVAPGLASMKANTSLAFLLSGLALWLHLHVGAVQDKQDRFKAIKTFAGTVVLLLGLLTLAEYVLGISWFIDQWIVQDTHPGERFPGRMSAATAFIFTLFGLALLMMRRPGRWRYLASVLAFGGLCLGLVGTVGYIYGVGAMYRFVPFSTMAVHTAMLFVCLGCGVLAAQPDQGVMAVVSSPYLGGWLTRRLWPSVVGLPLILGLLRVQGEQRGWFKSEMGTALLVGSMVAISAVLLWVCARALDQMNRDFSARQRDVAQLAAIVSASEDAIIDKNLDGVITGWNPAAETIFGYSAKAMIGQPVTRLFPSERLEEEVRIQAAIKEGARMELADTVRIDRAGAAVPVSVLVTPIRNELGRLIGASSLIRDNRDRLASQRSLAESLRKVGRFKTALDHHAIVAITDTAGDINYVNDKFRQVSQYTESELVGHDHNVVSSRHHSKEFFDEMWATIRRGGVWQGEIKNRAKDGSIYWIETTIVPFLDEAGVPYEYMSIGADITVAKVASEALQEQAKELQRSNLELEQFAYAASHDLQEPLRAVAGCLQVLERKMAGRLETTEKELIRHAVEGAGRMKALIEGLLLLSRVGTRGEDLRLVELDRALDAALENLSVAVAESSAIITRDELPVLPGDEMQLTQLLQNLIGNALKFRGEEPPQVHIGANQQAEAWEITVSDQGIGIEPQYAERIFTIFQRLHTRREFPGTGIGLTICRKIMDRHRGTIRVESTQGQGATFRCTFPKPRETRGSSLDVDSGASETFSLTHHDT